jgi:hypothetical protein
MRIELRGFKCDLTPEEEADLREQLEGISPRGEVCSASNNLLDAATLAERLGVSREFVYDHAKELGGEQLGNGPRGRWRFPAPNTSRRSTGSEGTARPDPRAKPSPPRRRKASSTELLAVRGKSPYPAPNEKRPPEAVEAPAEGLDKEG